MTFSQTDPDCLIAALDIALISFRIVSQDPAWDLVILAPSEIPELFSINPSVHQSHAVTVSSTPNILNMEKLALRTLTDPFLERPLHSGSDLSQDEAATSLNPV